VFSEAVGLVIVSEGSFVLLALHWRIIYQFVRHKPCCNQGRWVCMHL